MHSPNKFKRLDSLISSSKFINYLTYNVSSIISFHKNKKNNSINPIMEITVNNPKNKISQFATTKLLDNNGIQFIKIKEDETYTISNATHTSNTSDVKLPYTATSSYSASSGGIYYIHLNNINETAHADITDDSTDNIVELDWKPTIDYGVNQIIKAGTGMCDIFLDEEKLISELSDISVTEEYFVTVNNKNINDLLKEDVIGEEEEDYCENDDFQFSI